MDTVISILELLPQISIELIVIAFCIYVFFQLYALYSFNRYFYNSLSQNNIHIHALIICLCLYSIFAYNSSDFLGYVRALYFGIRNQEILEFEPIYNILLASIKYNNIGFRLIICTLNYFLLSKIIKNFIPYPKIYLLCFIVILLTPFSNIIRQVSSDLIGFLGVFTIYKYGPKSLKKIGIFILCSFLSMLLHKSAFLIFIPFILTALPCNNRSIRLYFAVYPVFAILVFIAIYLTKDLISSHYGSNEFDNNMTYVIRKVVTNTMTLILWIYILVEAKNIRNKTEFIGYIYRYCFFSLLIWIVLQCVPMSHFVAERFQNHCLLPISILFCWIITQKHHKRKGKVLKLIVVNYIIINILDNIYALYALAYHLYGKYNYLLN